MEKQQTLDELIASLNARDANRIYEQLRHRLDTKKAKAIAFTAQEDDFYTILHRVTNGRLLPKAELATHKKIRGRNGYKKSAACLFRTVQDGSGIPLRRSQLIALAQEAMSCLAEAMAGWGHPVSGVNLVQMVENNLEHALNEAYPEYLENRILHYLVPMLDEAAV